MASGNRWPGRRRCATAGKSSRPQGGKAAEKKGRKIKPEWHLYGCHLKTVHGLAHHLVAHKGSAGGLALQPQPINSIRAPSGQPAGGGCGNHAPRFPITRQAPFNPPSRRQPAGPSFPIFPCLPASRLQPQFYPIPPFRNKKIAPNNHPHPKNIPRPLTFHLHLPIREKLTAISNILTRILSNLYYMLQNHIQHLVLPSPPSDHILILPLTNTPICCYAVLTIDGQHDRHQNAPLIPSQGVIKHLSPAGFLSARPGQMKTILLHLRRFIARSIASRAGREARKTEGSAGGHPAFRSRSRTFRSRYALVDASPRPSVRRDLFKSSSSPKAILHPPAPVAWQVPPGRFYSKIGPASPRAGANRS